MNTLPKASRNQLGNANNAYQTNSIRVLCLCSAGLLRSPTLANVLYKEFGFNTRAAGVTLEYALIPVSEALLEWADVVVCVEKSVATKLADLVKPENPGDYNVVVLDVPDEYNWDNVSLRKRLFAEVTEQLDRFIRKR